MKNGPKIVKNENFQKTFFFCSFYVILNLHAKKQDYMSNGVTCGQYKDKERKNDQKNVNGPKNVYFQGQKMWTG